MNKPWTWSKSKRMTLGPLRPLWPFMPGYRWTKSCKRVTGKLTTHLYILPKRPYLVRRRQQYVSGTSSSSTTSPGPFPQTSSPRKEKKGGGGHIRCNQVFRSIIPGSRYMFTSSGCLGKVFYFSIYIVLCIKDF